MAAKSTPARGTFVGTGAAINISLGFTPACVKLFNVTDGDVTFEWFDSMAAGTAIQTDTAVAKLASNGISPYAGAAGSGAAGFTAGSSCSETGKTMAYIAWPAD